MDRIKWIKEQVGLKRAELETLKKLVTDEKRVRTEEETTNATNLRNEILALEAESKELEEDEKRAKDSKPSQEQRTAAAAAGNYGSEKAEKAEERDIRKIGAKYNLTRAVRMLDSIDPLDGVERELHEEARKESQESHEISYKGIGIPASLLRAEWEASEKRTAISQGTSDISPTVVGRYVESIRQNAVFSQVVPGSNILTGLTADFKIPIVGTQTTAWAAGENGAAADGGVNFASVTLSPYRLTSYATLSDKVLLQNGEIAMNVVMTDFGRAAAESIDDAIFATTSTTNAPPAIAAASGVATFTEAATYAAPSSTVNGTIYDDVLEALQVLANANTAKGALKYVGHTKLMTDLIKSPRVLSVSAGLDALQTGSPLRAVINGVPFYFTTSNTSSTTVSADFIAGDFNYQYIGMFGGLDMMIDPYTASKSAQKTLVLHRWIDAKTARGAGFVKATSLLS
jgi:HK97 family phage major capsid protein